MKLVVSMIDGAGPGRAMQVKSEDIGEQEVRVDATCPKCRCRPVRLRGAGRRIVARDTYAAEAHCIGCGAEVGTMTAQVPTLFGLEEDEAVAEHCRAKGVRVY